MMPNVMLERIRTASGFVAALDQSGGSTPRTLLRYGISVDRWSSETEMFQLIHEMRSRIITSSAFNAEKILGAILFEGTMEGFAGGQSVPALLLGKGIIPFLKVDEGLEDEREGVQSMKSMPRLNTQLRRARTLGIFGTKMRSVIKSANQSGIAAIVAQQFELGRRIGDTGLLPILEPEYDIRAADRAQGEVILKKEILGHLARLPADRQVMLKLSIPAEAGLYSDLAQHPRVARLMALSGGYTRKEACEKLAMNTGMIASFSRALLQDLRVSMSDDEFDTALGEAIDEIYLASISTRA